MSSSKIDSARLAAELEADADVARSLRANGDVPSLVRPVDVRFVGNRANVERLVGAIESLGWRVVQVGDVGGDSLALDVQRDQTTDPAALRALTEAALLIEQAYGVSYDGWGTVAQRDQASFH